MAATESTVEHLAVTVPNEAAEVLKRVAAHLAGGQESGLLMALVTRSPPRSSALQVRSYNVCGSDVMAAVVMFLQQHVGALRSCQCPLDHSAEIGDIEDIVDRLTSLAGFDQFAMPETAIQH